MFSGSQLGGGPLALLAFDFEIYLDSRRVSGTLILVRIPRKFVLHFIRCLLRIWPRHSRNHPAHLNGSSKQGSAFACGLHPVLTEKELFSRIHEALNILRIVLGEISKPSGPLAELQDMPESSRLKDKQATSNSGSCVLQASNII